MYEPCISCPKLGKPCNGPNFSALTTAARLDWIKKRKNFLGWSNAKLAEESNTPKGTIDSLLSGNRTSANTETLRPIFEALIGGYTDGKPCPNPPTETDFAIEEQLAKQAEVIAKHEKTIERLRQDNKKLVDHISHADDVHLADKASARADDQKVIEKQEHTIKFLRIVISVLAVIVALSVCTILVALILDFTDPTRGFIWLEEAAATVFSSHTHGVFDGAGLLEGIQGTKI